MKMLKLLSVAGMVACCAGCISSHVAWVEGWEPDAPQSIAAKCNFTGGDDVSALAAEKLNAVCKKDGDELPMTIYLMREEPKLTNGLFAKVNNIVSFFTLGVWPWMRAQDQNCTVEVVAFSEKIQHRFVIGHRAWSSFILPIGIIPCPGFITDWRSWPTLRLDFQRGPGQEKWEADVMAGYIGEMLTPEQIEHFTKRRGDLRK